jgi:hypothetical protein
MDAESLQLIVVVVAALAVTAIAAWFALRR